MSQATVWAHDSLCWALLTSCALLIWNVPKKNLCVLRIKFNHSSRSLASSRPNQNPFAWPGHRMCRQNSYTANWVLPAGLRHVYKKFHHFSFASPLLSTWLRLTQSMVKPDWLQIQQTVLLSLGGYFWPSEVRFRGILALPSDWFYNGHFWKLGITFEAFSSRF